MGFWGTSMEKASSLPKKRTPQWCAVRLQDSDVLMGQKETHPALEDIMT